MYSVFKLIDLNNSTFVGNLLINKTEDILDCEFVYNLCKEMVYKNTYSKKNGHTPKIYGTML